MSLSRITTAAFVFALVAGCGSGEPGVPPTGIDLSIPIADLDGFAEVEALAGEPPESERLETILASFREALAEAREARDPVDRADAEEGWWQQLMRSLTSTYGADIAAQIFSWCEGTFQRRRIGGAA